VNRGVLVTGLVVVSAAVALAYSGAFELAESRVAPGAPAPDFRAVTLDPQPAPRGIADYRGQVVLLNLWATWCGPCELEMPSIQALYNDFANAGLKVVAIAVDDPGFEQRIREFVSRKQLTFEVLHEGSGKIESDYEARGIPATYLIGRDGLIRKRVAGASDWNSPANRALVAGLLGVPVPAPRSSAAR
jgi:cytochrome c biogenesis protein CcmG/thiol:disulfide interchange protein DsbE